MTCVDWAMTRDTVAQCVIQCGLRSWEIPAFPSTRVAAMKLLGDCTQEHDELGAYRFVEFIDDPEFGDSETFPPLSGK